VGLSVLQLKIEVFWGCCYQYCRSCVNIILFATVLTDVWVRYLHLYYYSQHVRCKAVRENWIRGGLMSVYSTAYNTVLTSAFRTLADRFGDVSLSPYW